MRKTALFLGFFLLLTPGLAWAQTPACSAQGYTVVFVNGVLDTETQARADKNQLQIVFNKQNGGLINNESVTFQLGYNPTHLAGVGDLIQSAAQLFDGSISDFDLDTVLMQIYPEVTTRKLMLVGHSQGAFYTNSMYSYLLAHGEPVDSVGVYNVASPASYTAGGGKYIDSSGDTLLALLRSLHFDMLPNNIDLLPADQSDAFPGHSFINDYLASAAPQILGDIGGEMSGLKPTDATQTGDCFTPPNESLGYKTEAAAFAVADPAATVLKAGTVATVQTGAVAFNTAYTVAVAAVQMVADAVHVTAAPPSQTQTNTDTMKVINKLYGSSLDGLSAQDKKDLLGSSQGGAVVLAVAPNVPAPSTPSSPSIFPSSSNGPIIGGGGGSSQPVVAAQDIPIETITIDDTVPVVDSDTATSTDYTDASTTAPIIIDDTPPAPIIPALPTGAPVTDNFDSYDGSGWSTLSTNVYPSPFILFTPDNGSADTFVDANYTGSDCHSGGCIIANGGGGGFGGGGHTTIMYKETGVGQTEGAFTIWSRARRGWGGSSINIGLCEGESLGCESPNLYYFNYIPWLQDDVWHQFYMAWRQGSANVETCLLVDDTSPADCNWVATNVSSGTQFDGILLNGNAVRPDLGDQVWFDDLENANQ